MQEAAFYRTEGETLQCGLCPHRCRIGPGKRGFCRTRENRDGRLYALNYGQCSSRAIDPVEKKPLYHFYPGRKIFSVGTWGCNLGCQFCQNWQISQAQPGILQCVPQDVVAWAQAAGTENIGVAYTYSEPSVWFEFIRDTAPLVQQAGLKNVLVTNGYIEAEPLAELLPHVDALNIDVKTFRDTTYRRLCAGTLAPVLRTVETAAAQCHVEVTTLVVTGENDSEAEMEDIARWLAGVSPDIPLHISRYFPNYHFTAPPTPIETLERLYAVARRHLRFVYLGNLPGPQNNTYCPTCGIVTVDRQHGRTALDEDCRCISCGCQHPFVGWTTEKDQKQY